MSLRHLWVRWHWQKMISKEDFLLIESDTFYGRRVLEELAARTEGNCLSMTEESGSGDECFMETKNGFATKITKGSPSCVPF